MVIFLSGNSKIFSQVIDGKTSQFFFSLKGLLYLRRGINRFFLRSLTNEIVEKKENKFFSDENKFEIDFSFITYGLTLIIEVFEDREKEILKDEL